MWDSNVYRLETHKLSLRTALIPVIFLIILLTCNITIYGDDLLMRSNQIILLIAAAFAGLIGFRNKISYKLMLQKIIENLVSVKTPILILLFVGALAGTWLISGIIPAMIFYGIQIANPSFFLPACVLILSLIHI